MSTRLSNKLPASFQSVVNPALDALNQAQVIDRLWSKDHQLWKPNPKEIADRLGWLTVQDQMRQRLGQLQRCVVAAKGLNIKDVVLLGMGGSSLGPEVFRTLFGSQKGFPRLWVLARPFLAGFGRSRRLLPHHGHFFSWPASPGARSKSCRFSLTFGTW